MSAFTPIDVTGPTQRRLQVLQQLMQQFQANAMAASQVSGIGASGVPFKNSMRFGINPITQAINVAQGIQSALGPGGFSSLSAGSFSPAAGVPVPTYTFVAPKAKPPVGGGLNNNGGNGPAIMPPTYSPPIDPSMSGPPAGTVPTGGGGSFVGGEYIPPNGGPLGYSNFPPASTSGGSLYSRPM